MAKNSLVALFIDSENASPKHVGQIVDFCRSLGRLSILRCYGGAAGLKKWEKVNTEHHIVGVMTLASAAKANASDFALTIDAVSLLHRDMFDHAVIASSDADFTQLAVHIREQGKGVHGVGEGKASESLKSSFDTFITLTSPTTAKKAKVVAADKANPPPVSAKAAPTPAKPAPKKAAPVAKEIPKRELLQTFEALSSKGSVSLAVFGKAFRTNYPGIEVGKGKFKKMLTSMGFKVNDQQVVTRD